MLRTHFEIGETAVTIICDERYQQTIRDAIFEARGIIERKISEDPFFKTTYEPYRSSAEDDELIKRMCDASLLADVGPMASVAGAVAFYAVEKAIEHGATHAIIDNGGDVAMIADHPVIIGLYAGNGTEGLSLRIEATHGIMGICSSSGKVGPSVSFGNSDICTVISKDVILADAVATRLGNLITITEMKDALESVVAIEGVGGCIASIGGRIAMCGDIPEIVLAETCEEKITKVEFG